jgi:alkylated DNA repair dioxygenase AlkB
MEAMTGVPPLSWQGSLFDEPASACGAGPLSVTEAHLGFSRLVRHRLDERSWLDEVSGWVSDHGDVFDLLLAEAPWRQRERWMYEKRVLEPRMVAGWSDETLPQLPARLEEMRAALSAYYGVEFDSVLVNLYRDGRDGVAWHGDTVRKTLQDPIVATVSLGERRRFLLRPGTSGPAKRTFTPGGGDLLVMGGACQHEWQHTVPKVARAGARMSVTLRHSQEGLWAGSAPGRSEGGR